MTKVLNKKRLDRDLLSTALLTAIEVEVAKERAKREEAVAAERAKREEEKAKMEEAVAAERAKTEEERAKREKAVAAERAEAKEERAKREEERAKSDMLQHSLYQTEEALRQKNMEYLRLKGGVDIRSAMGKAV